MKRGRRKPSETLRVYGPPARRAWVKSLPCIVCYQWPSENMHIKGGGVGRKADARFIVPACRKHHAEAHRIGIESFADRHFLFLDEEAARVEAMWQALQAIGALHTTDSLCARCRASFREDDSAFCGSCQELNRQERPDRARKRPPRDAA